MQEPIKQVMECQTLTIVLNALLELSSLESAKQKKRIATGAGEEHMHQVPVSQAHKIVAFVMLERFKPDQACRQRQTARCAGQDHIRLARE